MNLLSTLFKRMTGSGSSSIAEPTFTTMQPEQPTPVATITEPTEVTITVRLGFVTRTVPVYAIDETYAGFVERHANKEGMSLQDEYTAQLIINDRIIVLEDTDVTFKELQEQHNFTVKDKIEVSVPDPEKGFGEQG
jgi:hypothetical protein